jgi:hypothetical protein
MNRCYLAMAAIALAVTMTTLTRSDEQAPLAKATHKAPSAAALERAR